MEKWEYLTVRLKPATKKTGGLFFKQTSFGWNPEYFTEQLKFYGEQGWELVSCFSTQAQIDRRLAIQTGGTSGIFAAFKRRKT